MEADDRQPSARAEQDLGGGEAAHQFADFVVDVDPNGLKRPGRRVDRATPTRGGIGAANDIGQLSGALDPPGAARLDDGARDTPGKTRWA